MEEVGYSYARMESEGIMMPVLSAECEYKNSVKFGDSVVIKTAISEFNGFKMTVQYLVIKKKYWRALRKRQDYSLFHRHGNEAHKDKAYFP